MSAASASIATYVLEEEPALALRLLRVFGSPDDPLAQVERRMAEQLPEFRAILWEGDPLTFQFSHVSASAEQVLGYPARRWVDEPNFWTDVVVHADDRRDAVAFCALATAQNRNHDFRYRARTADGRVITLLDVVQVAVGGRGVAVRLRGIMLELTADAPIEPRGPRRLPAAND